MCACALLLLRCRHSGRRRPPHCRQLFSWPLPLLSGACVRCCCLCRLSRLWLPALRFLARQTCTARDPEPACTPSLRCSPGPPVCTPAVLLWTDSCDPMPRCPARGCRISYLFLRYTHKCPRVSCSRCARCRPTHRCVRCNSAAASTCCSGPWGHGGLLPAAVPGPTLSLFSCLRPAATERCTAPSVPLAPERRCCESHGPPGGVRCVPHFVGRPCTRCMPHTHAWNAGDGTSRAALGRCPLPLHGRVRGLHSLSVCARQPCSLPCPDGKPLLWRAPIALPCIIACSGVKRHSLPSSFVASPPRPQRLLRELWVLLYVSPSVLHAMGLTVRVSMLPVHAKAWRPLDSCSPAPPLSPHRAPARRRLVACFACSAPAAHALTLCAAQARTLSDASMFRVTARGRLAGLREVHVSGR
jgi:hypothetical protein